MKKTYLAVGFAAAALFTMTSIAGAAVTVYTSRAAFNAATINQQIITFNAQGTTNAANNYGSSETIEGVTFSTDGASPLYVIDTGYGGGAYFFNGGGGPYLNDNNYYQGFNLLTTMTAALPANVRAVGADVGLQTTTSVPTFISTVDLSTGDHYEFTNLPVDPTFSFLGFVSDTDLTSISFKAALTGASSGNGGSGSYENFTLATPAPEPASMSLILIGVASTLSRRRCRA